ncbi:MAG TPA: serine/threonine-protein kinase, partial [Candidatus Nanopelagicales bacterium]|nr:serine/threonine-protein kinase [Candidatus Nanopelagicales bacterium]
MKEGDHLHHYRIVELLGKGGTGEVYAAVDTRLGRLVALKRIRGDRSDMAVRRLLREARAAAAFEHPNVVTLYDIGEDEGAPYIAMEHVRGRTLRGFIGNAALPMTRRLRWLIDVGRALGAAHRAGLVHRDVKPDNVMVRDDGVIKVLDFGIARRASLNEGAGGSPLIGTVTEEGVVVGTRRYASPEQLRAAKFDGRSDQFSWAVMAYELIVGVMPWDCHDTLELLSQIIYSEPPPMATRALGASTSPDAGAPPLEVPAEVEAAVLRAMAKSAEDRFPTIDEAADALEPFAEVTRLD